MSNNHSTISTEQQALSAPHGVLSTRLTDASPDYAWFDCETEL